MSIQRGLVWPLLNKNEMPRVFMIYVQVVGDTVGLQSGFFHQFGLPRANRVQVLGLDKVFSNHFQHVERSLSGSGDGDVIGLKAVGPGHLPHA